MEKRFFWLKLRETFFNETYIKAMRTFKNGDSLVLTYLEMALYSLKSNGVIERGTHAVACGRDFHRDKRAGRQGEKDNRNAHESPRCGD